MNLLDSGGAKDFLGHGATFAAALNGCAPGFAGIRLARWDRGVFCVVAVRDCCGGLLGRGDG